VPRKFRSIGARGCGLGAWLTAAVLSLPIPVAADASGIRAGITFEERALAASQVTAGESAPGPQSGTATRNALLIGGASLAVAAYGADKWWRGGFGGGFDTEREGWFGSDTEFGGVDKLGHAYANYVGVRLLTPVFEELGNNRRESISLATWSTLAIYTAVEVLDGFSRKYHFSIEDAIANVAGVALGRATESNRRLDEIFDFRLYYRRSPYAGGWDPLGDYSGQRYLLVVKADAFAPMREHAVLRYLEAAVGYGARGFDAGPDTVVDRRRELYFGVSLNLSRVVSDAFYGGRRGSTTTQRNADRLFDVVQFPTIVTGRRGVD